MIVKQELAEGARNLLVNCAELLPHESLLIIHENPALGWYDLEAPMAVADEAKKLGVSPSLLEVGKPGNHPDPGVTEAMATHDCIIFFARIGDQDRFADPVPGRRIVMCYTRDAEMLASSYGRTPHQAFRDLKEAVNAILLNAKRIEINCPLGTDYAGFVAEQLQQQPVDVSVRRFPLGVPLPMDASGFSGHIALTHFLTPTGSKVYDPAFVKLKHTLFVDVELGRIKGFSGDVEEVSRVQEHYQRVANKFKIDRDVLHSWHAGIHPGCAYTTDANQDPDRWSNTVFTHPRCLHFHSCGNYPPGEISWIVLDHSITIDGENLWENGRLQPMAFDKTKQCLESWPQLDDLFTHPSNSIGLPATNNA